MLDGVMTKKEDITHHVQDAFFIKRWKEMMEKGENKFRYIQEQIL